MNKSHDTATIISITILIFFCVFSTMYIIHRNNNSNTSTNNYDGTSIYQEHIHELTDIKSDTNIKKVYEDIASYTTKIYDKDKNRIYNIKLAAKRLDDHIIKSGEEFSFISVMGKMDKEDGYKKALGFDSNGNKIKMYGGGICQISSTLYNCVLIADLPVTERHAHSRRVYYVPQNKDATVFYGGPDFRFINNTSSNIIICVSTDGYNVSVTLKQEKDV